MKEVEILYPLGGVVQIAPFAKQPKGTTPHSINSRPFDPKTGRIGRGGPRSGTSPFDSTHDQVNGANKIQCIAQGSYGNPPVTYSNPATAGSPPILPIGNVDWATKTATGKTAYHLRKDVLGNDYVLDAGGTVTKLNTQGKIAASIGIPLTDAQQVCRSLAVDEFFNIFVGVTYGGDQKKASIWKYQQKPDINDVGNVDEASTLLWTLTTGEFVGDMVVEGGVLYVGLNNDLQHKSRIVAYTELNAAKPTRLWSSKAAWPVRGIAVTAGQAVFATSPEADGSADGPGDRSVNPLDANVSYVTDQGVWTPQANLTDAAKRIWSDLDSERIDGDLVGTDEYEQGDPIDVWHGLTDDDRNLVSDGVFGAQGGAWTGGANASNVAPIYNKLAFAGKPGVTFAGGQITASSSSAGGDGGNQSMISLPNYGWIGPGKHQQRTIIPSYTGAGANEGMFCLFILCQGRTNATSGQVAMQALIAQRNANNDNNYRAIVFNSAIDSSAATWTDTIASGAISFRDYQSTAAVTNSPTYTGYDGGPVLITVLCDGNKGGTIATATDTVSVFRVNGQQIGDRWKSNTTLAGTIQTIIAGRQATTGEWAATGWTEFWGGDIKRIFCLREYPGSSDAVAAGKVLSHPTVAYGGAMTYAGVGAASPTEMEKIEGWIMHDIGAQGKLHASHPYVSSAPLPSATSVNVNLLNTTKAVTAKYKPSDGSIVGIVQAGANDYMGAGIAVYKTTINSAVGSLMVTVGNNAAATQGGLSQFLDSGDTFGLVGSTQLGVEFTDTYPRLDVDYWGNFYIPVHQSDTASASNMLYVFNIGSGLADPSVTWGLDYLAAFTLNQGSYAVAVSKQQTDFTGSTAFNKSPSCTLASDSTNYAGTIAQDTVRRIRLLDTTVASGAPRTVVTAAVAGGTLKRKNTGAGYSAPSSVSGSLSGSAKYIDWTFIQDELAFVDGKTAQSLKLKTDVYAPWLATTAGELPAGPQLVATWRDRAVIVGIDRYNWYMSKQGDMRNWNYTPAVANDQMAVQGAYNFGGNTAGKCPDIINTLIPWSQNILIFGCVNSIQVLIGDPAQGGYFKLLSDVTGMAYGRPWCKSPDGVIYFMGSRGDMYRIPPGGYPEPVSQGKMPRRLRSINLSTNYFRLEWDDENSGVFIKVMPFGAGGTLLTHFYYHRETDGFWPDQYGTASYTGMQPTAILAADGDAESARKVLIGCEDGRIRVLDRSVDYDIGTTATDKQPINNVVVFQVNPDGVGEEFKFERFKAILSPSESGCYWQLMTSRTAEPPLDSSGNFILEPSATVVNQGHLIAGSNPTYAARMKGPYCWLLLRSNVADQRYTFEGASIMAEAVGGKARVYG